MSRVDIQSVYRFFSRRSRLGRMEAFMRTMRPTSVTTILDIGGTPEFWEGTNLQVTLLNTREPTGLPPNLSYVKGDATQLPYSDSAFDIVFSNSTIEHLHTAEAQRGAAVEAMRVGRRLWMQTPNRWFAIEPHYLTPFIHWFPSACSRESFAISRCGGS